MAPEELDQLITWLRRVLLLDQRAAATEADAQRTAADARIVERCMSAVVAVRSEPDHVGLDASDLAEHVLAEMAYGRRRDAPGWRAAWTPDGLPDDERRRAQFE